jgi:hypothetical protein
MNVGKWRKHCPMARARKANRKTRVVLRVAVGRIKADEITLFLAANCKVGAKKFDRAICGKNRDERLIGEALFTVGFGFGIHRFGAQLEADAGATANMSHAHSSAGVVQGCGVIVQPERLWHKPSSSIGANRSPPARARSALGVCEMMGSAQIPVLMNDAQDDRLSPKARLRRQR